MFRRFAPVFIAFCLLCNGASAKDPQIQSVINAWQKWAKDNNVTKSTLSFARNGEIIHSQGIGAKAGKKMEMASLSKTITAACVATLQTKGMLKYTSTIEDVLGDVFPNLAAEAKSLTVSQLLTHTSGLGPDSTQRLMAQWIGGTGRPHFKVSKLALHRAEQSGTRGRYLYNNENYAVLGLIVETVTNQSYAAYCHGAVLKSNGIKSASLKSEFGAFAAWGGWRMSADDYNRFLIGNFGPETKLGSSPQTYPSTKVDGPVSYGMGTFARQFRKSYNYWHFGLLCFENAKRRGSYFAYFEGQHSVVVTYNICSSWDQMFALDGAIASAVYSIP